MVVDADKDNKGSLAVHEQSKIDDISGGTASQAQQAGATRSEEKKTLRLLKRIERGAELLDDGFCKASGTTVPNISQLRTMNRLVDLGLKKLARYAKQKNKATIQALLQGSWEADTGLNSGNPDWRMLRAMNALVLEGVQDLGNELCK